MKPADHKRVRRLRLARIIAVPIIAVAGSVLWNHYQSSPEHKLIILVADFQPPDPQTYDLTKNIIEQLGKASSKYDAIELRSLGEIVPHQSGSEIARERGREHNAAIVLWGGYEKSGAEGLVSVHFEILHNRSIFRITPERKETVSVAAARLDSLTIRQPLSAEMTYLTLMALGFSGYCAQDFERAIASFSDAILKNTEPEQIENLRIPYVYRGISYLYLYRKSGDQRQIDRAIADFNEALKIVPYDPLTYFNRGLAHFEKGEYELSIADYDQALQLKPDYAEAYFVRGNSFDEKGALDRAISDYDQTIELNPKHAGAYNNRGDTYLKKRQIDSAIADYDQAINLRPNFANTYLSRGEAYAINGDKENAIANFDKALQLTRRPDQRQRAIQAIEGLNSN